uniref:CCHC-type domain-containing protein n=1 Tax=Eptatretus burgeri TaxID=7764 RepID=A0A8C4Q8U6_EPTBU
MALPSSETGTYPRPTQRGHGGSSGGRPTRAAAWQCCVKKGHWRTASGLNKVGFVSVAISGGSNPKLTGLNRLSIGPFRGFFFYPGQIRKCNRCNEAGHLSARFVFYPGQIRKCNRCNEAGHLSASCPNPRCPRCGQVGHVVHECVESVSCNLCGKAGHLSAQTVEAVPPDRLRRWALRCN